MMIYHQPVMVREVIDGLRVGEKGVYVDATVGEGGHAYHILHHTAWENELIGLDRDAGALEIARNRLSAFQNRVTLVNENYVNLEKVLTRLTISHVSGILLDLGYSSYQMDAPQRGFSFTSGERLDMRFDKNQTQTAYDLVNSLSQKRLKDIFWKFGEERWAGRIAALIVKQRSNTSVKTCQDLAEIVLRAVPASRRPRSIHPATRIFQALRIAVNEELEHLQQLMNTFPDRLLPEGRMVVISYHSLEDRIVKNAFKYWAAHCRCPKDLPRCTCEGKKIVKVITPHPLFPSQEEVERNPRARSARLRVAEKV